MSRRTLLTIAVCCIVACTVVSACSGKWGQRTTTSTDDTAWDDPNDPLETHETEPSPRDTGWGAGWGRRKGKLHGKRSSPTVRQKPRAPFQAMRPRFKRWVKWGGLWRGVTEKPINPAKQARHPGSASHEPPVNPWRCPVKAGAAGGGNHHTCPPPHLHGDARRHDDGHDEPLPGDNPGENPWYRRPFSSNDRATNDDSSKDDESHEVVEGISSDVMSDTSLEEIKARLSKLRAKSLLRIAKDAGLQCEGGPCVEKDELVRIIAEHRRPDLAAQAAAARFHDVEAAATASKANQETDAPPPQSSGSDGNKGRANIAEEITAKVKAKAEDIKAKIKAKAPEIKAKIKAKAEDIKAKIKAKAPEIKAKAKNIASNIKAQARHTAAGAKAKISDFKSGMQGLLQGMKSKINTVKRKYGERVKNVAAEVKALAKGIASDVMSDSQTDADVKNKEQAPEQTKTKTSDNKASSADHEASCTDKRDWCPSKKQYCPRDYYKKMCPKTCGTCTDSTDSHTTGHADKGSSMRKEAENLMDHLMSKQRRAARAAQQAAETMRDAAQKNITSGIKNLRRGIAALGRGINSARIRTKNIAQEIKAKSEAIASDVKAQADRTKGLMMNVDRRIHSIGRKIAKELREAMPSPSRKTDDQARNVTAEITALSERLSQEMKDVAKDVISEIQNERRVDRRVMDEAVRQAASQMHGKTAGQGRRDPLWTSLGMAFFVALFVFVFNSLRREATTGNATRPVAPVVAQLVPAATSVPVHQAAEVNASGQDRQSEVQHERVSAEMAQQQRLLDDAAVAGSHAVPAPAVEDQAALARLSQMGFDAAACSAALAAAGGNVSQAVGLLIEAGESSTPTEGETMKETPTSDVEPTAASTDAETSPLYPSLPSSSEGTTAEPEVSSVMVELAELGFTDEAANEKAVRDADGDLKAAVKALVAAERASSRTEATEASSDSGPCGDNSSSTLC